MRGTHPAAPMRVNVSLRHAGWISASLLAGLLVLAPAPAPAQTGPTRVALPSLADVSAPARRSSGVTRHRRVLEVGGRQRRRAFMRFDTRSFGGPVARATLRVYVRSAPRGRRLSVLRVRRGRWSERRGTPRAGGSLGRAVRARPRRWVAVDVTGAGPAGGRWDLALASAGARALGLASRESRRAPRLVLEAPAPGDAGGPTAPGGTTLPGGTTPGGTSPAGPGGDAPLAFPIRAAFYYPWFPATWTVNGAHVLYRPSLGYYSSDDQSVVDSHIRSLRYAKVDVAIASWWGPGEQSEATRLPLLMSRTTALGGGLKWAVYYEDEGFGDPPAATIASDLAYLRDHLAGRSEYARIGGKPVVFVYADGDDCSMADRWKAAAGDWYVVLKVMSGYTACASQPAAWHQYGPSSGEHVHRDSYVISPGYWQADEPAPRLARDVSAWRGRVQRMVASGKPWQLVTTFNEWGEGTAVESADEWQSASGQGQYLDALHDDGG